MHSSVEKIEKIVDAEIQQVSTLSSKRELENLSHEAQKSHVTVIELLNITEKQLEVSKDQLNVGEQQLSIQEEQLQVQRKLASGLRPQELKCLQALRLPGDENSTYEMSKDRIVERIPGTCKWFLKHPSYSAWLEGSGSLLLLADPGCGKSVLSKFLIDEELHQRGTVCYLFFKDPYQTTLKQALCALLHQLLGSNKALIRYAMPIWDKDGDKVVNNISSLWGMLQDAAHDAQRGVVIFVIDALDECKTEDLQLFLKLLSRPYDSRFPDKVKYLFTSRPYDIISREADSKLTPMFRHVVVPGKDNPDEVSNDINLVIRDRVTRLADLRGLNEGTQNRLEERLTKTPDRTYLWIYLLFDFLEQEPFKRTPKGIDAQLASLPESVHQAYDKILSRAKNQEKLRKALCIILAATRPLTLSEMNVAMNIES